MASIAPAFYCAGRVDSAGLLVVLDDPLVMPQVRGVVCGIDQEREDGEQDEAHGVELWTTDNWYGRIGWDD